MAARRPHICQQAPGCGNAVDGGREAAPVAASQFVGSGAACRMERVNDRETGRVGIRGVGGPARRPKNGRVGPVSSAQVVHLASARAIRTARVGIEAVRLTIGNVKTTRVPTMPGRRWAPAPRDYHASPLCGSAIPRGVTREDLTSSFDLPTGSDHPAAGHISRSVSMLNDRSILITGGTGSFGQAFVRTVLVRYPAVRRLVVFSRDELKQFEMAQRFPASKHQALRYFIGDVRDVNRLYRATEGINIVVHAAALKQVPAAEYNPFECIKTNVLGAQNVIEACLDAGAEHVVALSTDKAAAPINLYGATKLCSDKLFTAANNIKGPRNICFSVVRYGNVMGSRGSVIPFFLERRKTGVLPITDPAMTRFNISLQEGVDMVLWALEHSHGGEIFVPKIPSYRITDLANAIGPDCEHPVIGIRPGEKIHEEMITSSDSFNTVDLGNYFAILPSAGNHSVESYCAAHGGHPVRPGYAYDSGSNSDFLTVEQLRHLIAKNVTEPSRDIP